MYRHPFGVQSRPQAPHGEVQRGRTGRARGPFNVLLKEAAESFRLHPARPNGAAALPLMAEATSASGRGVVITGQPMWGQTARGPLGPRLCSCATARAHAPAPIPSCMHAGGSKGLGFAMAREFLAAGDSVVICGRDPGRLEVCSRPDGSNRMQWGVGGMPMATCQGCEQGGWTWREVREGGIGLFALSSCRGSH